jgi:hypothetical protein
MILTLKIFLVLCLAEIYGFLIKSFINWLEQKINFHHWKTILQREKIYNIFLIRHRRHLIAETGISLFLAYKTIWALW